MDGGAVQLRFRTGPAGGYIAFFNAGHQVAHFGGVSLQDKGRTTVSSGRDALPKLILQPAPGLSASDSALPPLETDSRPGTSRPPTSGSVQFCSLQCERPGAGARVGVPIVTV